jgi:hypothetical protein
MEIFFGITRCKSLLTRAFWITSDLVGWSNRIYGAAFFCGDMDPINIPPPFMLALIYQHHGSEKGYYVYHIIISLSMVCLNEHPDILMNIEHVTCQKRRWSKMFATHLERGPWLLTPWPKRSPSVQKFVACHQMGSHFQCHPTHPVWLGLTLGHQTQLEISIWYQIWHVWLS